VAGRTDSSKRAQIEVPIAVRDQLNQYKADLQEEMARDTSSGQLISALLSGVPLWQAIAMIDAYRPRDDPGSQGT
jgi:hypothetical protein